MGTSQAVHEAERSLQTILKAVVAGAQVGDAASRQVGEDESSFTRAGALEPPYDPLALCTLFELSNALRQNIDAYATNMDGFGHRFEAPVDLDADDAKEKVADAMALERMMAGDAENASAAALPDQDVAARVEQLRRLARMERAQLEAFFEIASFDSSFVGLRRRTRQDVEACGNAYWEVLRDTRGRIARFVYVPAYTVRLMPLDRDTVEVAERVRVGLAGMETVTTRRRLRRYVQLQQGLEATYFKEFGDPRVVSRATGRIYESVDALKATRTNDGPATEILHFKIHSPRSPYGVPRWVGTLLSVLGSREAEEVNYLYFQNKSVPPLALLVSGGRLSDGSVPRIERYIEEHLKGKGNFHKILILEADGPSTGDSGRAKIELHPLTDAQMQDALFQNYDAKNIDKVGSAFRLPKLLRGDTAEFNRATAESALRFAEDQVFAPERDEFDYFLNHRILADLGIRYWKFRSQTPITRDPERLSVMIERLVRVGVLTPEEARILAADVFNTEFRRIGDDWTKRPITLTLAGIQTGVQDVRPGGAPADDTLIQSAKRLLTLREDLRAEEDRLAKGRLDLARRYLDEEAVKVPREEFDAWFGGDANGPS